MKRESEIYVGSKKLSLDDKEVKGKLVDRDGEPFYMIENYDHMRPFLMSMTSDSDIWMFLSSNGGITAGRKNADQAVFPYCTDDVIIDQSEHTGSKTLFLVRKNSGVFLWTPFSASYGGMYELNRNLYKNALGNKIIFEEVNHTLGLSYTYSWFNSRKYGIIKRSVISNLAGESLEIQLLDGLVNIMPSGILQNVQQTKSNLASAYKKNELLIESGLGIYSLSSNIIDRPEPSESLLATVVWSTGLERPLHLLSVNQVHAFIQGKELKEEHEIRGEPGAYLVAKTILIGGKQSRSWSFVIDTGLSPRDVVDLDRFITNEKDLSHTLNEEIRISSEHLVKLVAMADGLQVTADKKGDLRHLSNTLFNIMRGGVFADGYMIAGSEFADFVQIKNRALLDKHREFLKKLPGCIHIQELKKLCGDQSEPDLERLAFEYLPITFSRRHGDPSRPWNRFNIDVLNEDGSWKKEYEGNWRDIFQNWEALCYSFPDFIENTITIFLNASTIDGYNPYRITSKGIEWEITDPADPWSFIGYWGDHQIIYLLKLLEISSRFHPGYLGEYVNKPFFTYSNVPYRIKGYADIVENPYSTIDFDDDIESQVSERVREVGEDGRLIWEGEGIMRATLTEKMLIPLLVKLSNFVPEGGIWMNTQRPEWNDANNALVGHGLSMVTVCYLYRYLLHLQKLYTSWEMQVYEVRHELRFFLEKISRIFEEYSGFLDGEINDRDRKKIIDALGTTGEQYREQVYNLNYGKKVDITREDLLHFIDLSLSYLKHTIQANRRPDGLYHSYNLLKMEDSGCGIEHLYPMLEGQVAVLSSGYIHPGEANDILNALQKSDLYRKDQDSYLLYPDRDLPLFIEKANINRDFVSESRLLSKLVEDGNTSIIQWDVDGNYHFNPELSNADQLNRILDQLEHAGYDTAVSDERKTILEAYENVFHHHQFTGRSGVFFAYEGLGSIYWHMNSKLLLTVQENFYKSISLDEDPGITASLKSHYYAIRKGLGTWKNPELYGAFPTDPYSHTPAHKGAQQPGMTGQVKEDLLSRRGELGLTFEEGCLRFQSTMIREQEFLQRYDVFEYFTLQGDRETIDLPAGSMGFMVCQVPVIYINSDIDKISIHFNGGKVEQIQGNVLSSDISKQIFGREGTIKRIEVFFKVN